MRESEVQVANPHQQVEEPPVHTTRLTIRALILLTIGVLYATNVAAQARVQPPPVTTENWIKPFPPLRIVGNIYYVGTYDLASYLIVTPEGNILINTGVESSVPMIRSSVEALGFKFPDIKLLLATHGHWDHVAGMAEIKRLTRARMLMNEGDAPMLEDGGSSDFRNTQPRAPTYEPVKVDQRLKDGDKVNLGGTELTVHHHPGHTKGATSFTLTVPDGGRNYRVIIANMGSINPGVKVSGMPNFLDITQAYARTFREQKQMQIDIWLASHAGQFALHTKYKPGDPYKPDRFVDPMGFRASVERLEKIYLDQLAQENQAK